MARRATVLLLAALGLAACGGGKDKQEAEQTVRDFVKATNTRDADKLCNDLFSKDFIEQTTGATGDKAKSTCKQQFKQLRAPKRRLVRITKTKVDGDKAAVTTIVESQDQELPQVFSLVKE